VYLLNCVHPEQQDGQVMYGCYPPGDPDDDLTPLTPDPSAVEPRSWSPVAPKSWQVDDRRGGSVERGTVHSKGKKGDWAEYKAPKKMPYRSVAMVSVRDKKGQVIDAIPLRLVAGGYRVSLDYEFPLSLSLCAFANASVTDYTEITIR